MFPLHQRKRFPGKPGFTLWEMLLVLALLVTVAALAMPTISSLLGNQRIKKSGDILKAAWGEAQLDAMETGRIQIFRYQLGGNRYYTQPWQAEVDETEETNTDDGLPLNALLIKYKRLPENVRFAQGDMETDTRDLDVLDEVGDARGNSQQDYTRSIGGPEEDDLSDALWSTPIVFYPDGTSSTAEVILANRRGRFLVVSLRGLTAIAVTSPLFTFDELTDFFQAREEP